MYRVHAAEWRRSRRLSKFLWRRRRLYDNYISAWHGIRRLFIYHDRGGFYSIPHIISYHDTTITVIVEDRKPLCWHCKHLGHFLRSCSQRTIITNKTTADTATTDTITAKTTTTTTTTTTTAITKRITDLNPETGHHSHKEEGWTLVKGKKETTRKSINWN